MARTFTLAQLRTKVRERADIAHSQHITDAELNGYISSSYAELYDLLVKSSLCYFESTSTVTTDGVDGSYALPSDFYGAIGVDYLQSAGQYVDVPELMPQERNLYSNTSTNYYGCASGYRVVGSNLVLYPSPPSGQTYRLTYIPAPTDLTSNAMTVDGVSGWEELIVVDSAIKCMAKEESDTGYLERERQRLMMRIEEAAENRAMTQARRVVDVNCETDPYNDWWL